MTAFPDGFLWGAATDGHQVEGGNVNADIWPLEWAEDSLFTEPSGDACDHYHHYPRDIATLPDSASTLTGLCRSAMGSEAGSGCVRSDVTHAAWPTGQAGRPTLPPRQKAFLHSGDLRIGRS